MTPTCALQKISLWTETSHLQAWTDYACGRAKVRSKYPSQPRGRPVALGPPRPDRITEREECAVCLDRTDGGENTSKSVQRYYNGSIHGGTDQTILISSKHSLIIAAAVMSVHVIICLASAGVPCQTRMLAPPCVQSQRFCGGIAHFCWAFWTI